jgi:AAT family amino acid transporter
MLAAMFGLGRMIRSLADEGQAPSWVKDKGDIPYRGILFSGLAMLGGLGLSFLLPQHVYLFLISSGGFALLFTYVVILATHYKFRKQHGCPPKEQCQLPGYPYTSWLAMTSSIAIIVSMPLIPGQGSGLLAGLLLIVLFVIVYFVKASYMKNVLPRTTTEGEPDRRLPIGKLETQFELAEELSVEQPKIQQDKAPGNNKNR